MTQDSSKEQIRYLESLPAFEADQVERIDLLVQITNEDPNEGLHENPTVTVDRYTLEIHVHQKDKKPQKYAMSRRLIDLFLTVKFGDMYMARNEADKATKDGKSVLSLIRNEVIDDNLLPRDPDYQTKINATLVVAIDTIRSVTTIRDISKYRLWFVRADKPWIELPLCESFMEKTRHEAEAINFKPPKYTPTMISDIGGD